MNTLDRIGDWLLVAAAVYFAAALLDAALRFDQWKWIVER